MIVIYQFGKDVYARLYKNVRQTKKNRARSLNLHSNESKKIEMEKNVYLYQGACKGWKTL